MNSIWGWIRDLLAAIGFVGLMLGAWYFWSGKPAEPNADPGVTVEESDQLVQDIRRSLDAEDYAAVCALSTAGKEQARERKAPMEQYRHWVNLSNHACMLGLKSEMRKSLDALESAK